MTPSKTCPKCGSAASGNFCGNCGTSLKARHCTQCGASLQAGARFCTQCGAGSGGGGGASRKAAGSGAAAGADGGGGSGDPNVAWWFAGGLLVLLILVVAWPILRPDQVAPVPTQAPATGGALPDLNSMTPLEAANRLFDRVMQSAAAGDSTQVRQFVPMAIQAYEGARPLDVHGLFDLSTLQRTGGDFAGALATADEGLAVNPDHLLLLYAAAQAAEELGDGDTARAHYQHLLDVWDAEMASGNLDYQAHGDMLPSARADALAFTGGDA